MIIVNTHLLITNPLFLCYLPPKKTFSAPLSNMTLRYTEYSNITIWGIKSTSLRYTWTTFFLFIFLSSLLGDTTILVASTKHKAFKLHKVLVTVIQHLAVSDLMVSFSDLLPKIISTLADGWVLGDSLCYLSFYTR